MSEQSVKEGVELIQEFGPNCLLGICCPPSQQEDVLATAIANSFGWSAEKTPLKVGNARAVAEWVLAHFDLAPKNSITPLLRKAGELARE